MKRTISLILIMALFVSILSGCETGGKDHSISNKNATEEPTSVPTEREDEENADDLLLAVLSGDAPMVMPSGAAEYLSEYLQAQNNAELIAYALVDFDYDGYNEMVLETSSELYTYIVLHCTGSDVFAFLFGSRQLGELKADGSFLGSNGAASTAYFTLHFNGGGYISTCEASGDYAASIFEINGKPCSEQEFNAFTKAWDTKEFAKWINCTSESKSALTHEDIIAALNQVFANSDFGPISSVEEIPSSIGILYSFTMADELAMCFIHEVDGKVHYVMTTLANETLISKLSSLSQAEQLSYGLMLCALPIHLVNYPNEDTTYLPTLLLKAAENNNSSNTGTYVDSEWEYTFYFSDVMMSIAATNIEIDKFCADKEADTSTGSGSESMDNTDAEAKAIRVFNSTTKPNWNGYDFETLTQIVFTDYLIQCDAYQGSDTQFLVTLSGNYCPNVVNLPEITRYGSMTFLVDTTTCTVSPVEDTGIEEAFETYIALGTPWYLNPDGSINWRDENIPSTTNPPSQQQETALPYLEKIERADQSIFNGPGYDYSFAGTIEVAGTYTIVEEAWDDEGYLWGKLKSGAGWVDLTDIRSNERRSELISANFADKTLLDSGNYHQCIADTSEYMVQIAFRTNEILTDFTLYSMQFNGVDFVTEDLLFSLAELNPDKPLVADVSFPGDMSMYGISFADSDGTIYNYSVSISGRNGSLVLSEYTP